MKKLNVAIIGQGRSGRNIHGDYFKSEQNTNYTVVAVVERDAERRKRAEEEYPGCKSYADYTELFERDDIDVVVNASYSDEHYPISKDLLEHGFNVVCEKPMGRCRYECDNLIRIANEKNVMLAVFQQSLFAPNFVKAFQTARSGILGEIKQVCIRNSAFARRWDWQTLQCRLAGSVYNTGPHPIGHGLGFLDFDKNARVEYSKLDRVLASGDADDFAKILITAPGKPLIDIEIHSNDAYSPYAFKILGSRGTFVCTAKDYKMTYMLDEENEKIPVVFESLKDENGYPAYCGGVKNPPKTVTHEEEGEIKSEVFRVGNFKFYEMVYNRLVNNVPLIIKPEYAAQVVSVIETVHANNPLPVLY